jgi:hypothetical protein
MENKNILLIAAAVAAYFVLGGKDLLGGGASGGGGSKGTVETGFLIPQATQPINPPVYQQPEYQPTEKMWADVDNAMLSKKQANFQTQANALGAQGGGLSGLLAAARAGNTSISDVQRAVPASRPSDSYTKTTTGPSYQDAMKTGLAAMNEAYYTAPVTKKEASSSSSSSSSSKSQNYSSQGGGSYSNSGFGGWG